MRTEEGGVLDYREMPELEKVVMGLSGSINGDPISFAVVFYPPDVFGAATRVSTDESTICQKWGLYYVCVDWLQHFVERREYLEVVSLGSRGVVGEVSGFGLDRLTYLVV
jgi:hypothetical protein